MFTVFSGSSFGRGWKAGRRGTRAEECLLMGNHTWADCILLADRLCLSRDALALGLPRWLSCKEPACQCRR